MQIVYFVLGILLMIAEVLLPIFVLLPIGIGCFLAGFVFWITQSHFLSLLVGAILAFLSLFFIKRFHLAKAINHPVIGLVGQSGIVEGELYPQKVRVFGDVWEIHYDANMPQQTHFLPGTAVKIKAVIGNKVAIEKIS